jgi:hypothetical protein
MSNNNDIQIGGSSLISLEGLTKPATVLIEKISDAVGTLYRPRQIIREARAEAEADKIKAIAGIEISEIQRRGIVRFVEQQGKHQENFESVVAQAIPQLTDDAKPEEIDNDWLARFCEASKLVSDKEMQTLWARLLAGEANKSGTFTKRTIEQVSNLEKTDAEMFTRLCGYGWNESADMPLVYDLDHQIYDQQGITFMSLQHLDAIGLIQFNFATGFGGTKLPKIFALQYYGIVICLQLPQPEDNTMDLGKVLLTKMGKELAPISGSVGSDQFLEYIVARWQESGYAPYSPLPEGKPKSAS